MIADPYLATKDIGERRIIVSYHIRTHLPKGNMSCEWYMKNYPLWHSRAFYVFDRNWNNALRHTFTAEEINEWENIKKGINQLKCKKMHLHNTIYTNYTKDKIIELFKDEYVRLKSIPGFGHFTFGKYNKYRKKGSPSEGTIRKFFKTTKNFYIQVTKIYPDIYFDPIMIYTEDDYKYSIEAAYKKYDFISYGILNYSNGYIDANTYAKRYGSVENACKKFNIPYDNETLYSKIFLYVKKIVEELLPSIEIIKEKQWPEWLFYKKPLKVDMFLPFFNLAIEVDGEQHYNPNSIFYKDDPEGFKDQQIRDEIKNVRLPEHNITLIRIRDYEIDDTAEKIRYYVELLKTIQEYCAY
jgi:hypothetical protein